MECNGDYVNSFLSYIDSFVANIRKDDPLPVRAPSYKVTETEIDGQIIDIVYHYLNNRECPPYVRSLVAQRVWRAIRTPDSNSRDEDEGCDVIDHGNHTYEPMKLIQDVTGRANTIIQELQQSLSRDDVEVLPKFLPVSQYAIKNTRRRMEDRHILIQDLNTLYDLDPKIFGHPHSYYGVFDGHAGEDAAVYSAALLHQYLMQNPFYETDPVKALKHAFYITDTNFIKKTEKERLKGGTTAVVALVREKRLVVAWLGDSLALLVRKRKPVQIVEPHKPDSLSEKKRIEDIGGVVVNIQGTWRVLGQLAVSRAIGDVSYKPYVTSECDIKSLEICGDEDFLILACDGLWDNLTAERAVNIVYAYLLKNNGDTDGVGRSLVETARSSGSEDNITAVVVFLRPVSVLMEEETARISDGQVPEAESFVMTQKDALPPSFNAIFSPPENYSSSSSSNSSPNPMAEVHIPKEANGIETHAEEPSEVSPAMEDVHIPVQDYDSDEGVGIDISVERGKESPDTGVNPTEEEVDAALAELDSIPDGGCEAGEVEDEDDEDEEWSYYKMEPQQQQPQNEELIESETSKISIETENESEISPPICENLVFTKDSSPSASPPAPSSPRTVEGFVTSVELNTPEESYNTNLAINQSTEYFNGGQIEQNSGPFSVYVSSSPEPASIESPPINLHSSMPSAYSPLETEDPKLEIDIASASVEIVHAQSTVEVMSDFPTEVEVHTPEANILMEDISPIPEIMTQSFSGDTLPTEPYVDRPPFMEFSQIPEASNDNENDYFMLEKVESPNENVHIEAFASPNVTCSPVSIDIPGGPLETSQVNEYVGFEENILFHEPPNQFLPQDQIDENLVLDESEHISSSVHDILEESTDFVSSEQVQFKEEINKAFDAPLDQMMTSFHEDYSTDIMPSVPPPVIPEVELEFKEEPPVESPAAVSDLADKLSQIAVAEEIPVTPTVTAKAEPKRPVSAPRTTVSKVAPPKPSPRTVESKLTASKLSSTNTTASPGAKPTPKRPSSLGAGPKPLKKTEAATKVATSTSTTATKPRFTAMTSRVSTAQGPRPSTAPTSSTKATTGLKPKSTTPLLKPKSAVPQTGTAAPKTNTTSLPSKPKPSTTTAPKSRLATSSTTTTTKRLTTTTRPLSSTTTNRIGGASLVPNGVPSTKSTKTTTTQRTPLPATKKPLTPKPTTTSSTRVGSAPTTKPLPPSTRTSASSTLKQRSTTAPPPTKETKNTTNRMLSTARTTTTKLGSQTTTRTTTTTTAAVTKSRLNTSRTSKSPGLKSKKETEKVSPKAEVDAGATNGENKIVEEESSVEVKEKLVEEQCNITDNLIDVDDALTKVEAIVSVTPENILVNGDH